MGPISEEDMVREAKSLKDSFIRHTIEQEKGLEWRMGARSSLFSSRDIYHQCEAKVEDMRAINDPLGPNPQSRQ